MSKPCFKESSLLGILNIKDICRRFSVLYFKQSEKGKVPQIGPTISGKTSVFISKILIK